MAISDTVRQIKKFITDKSRPTLTPDEIQNLYNEYRVNIGLGPNASFSADAFNNLVNEKPANFHIFEKTKGPGGLEIHKKLTDESATKIGKGAEAANVRDTIELALKAQDKFNTAQKEYTESVATFSELIKKIPEKYGAQDVIGRMTAIKDEGIAAIKEQHKHELDTLTAKFGEEPFKTNLKETLGIAGEDDYKAVQKSMLDEINKSHKAQLSQFEKSTSESLKTLHDAAQKQAKEFVFIAHLHKNHETMREELRKIAAKKDADANIVRPLNAAIDVNENKLIISGITLNDLPVIKSITGREITHDSATGKFEMKLPHKIFNPLYYLDPRKNLESDLALLAQGVKASGYTGITTNINISNPKIAMERARQAYKANIEAGFEPKNINIVVNGSKIKPEDLFKENPSMLQHLEQKSAKIIKELADIKPPSSPSKQAEIKQTIVQLRDDAKRAAAAAAANPAQNPNPHAALAP